MEDESLSKRDRKRLNREKKREQELQKENQSSMVKKIAYIVAIILGAFLVWQMLSSGSSDDSSQQQTVALPDQISESANVKGDPNSQIVLIEYSDFQCPACAGYYPVVKQLSEKYADQIAIEYRHFPLRSIHDHAQLAAQAAEAAALQGKFWEMHDKLFENQTIWSELRSPESDFVSYAEEIGLDTDKFRDDLRSDAVKNIVNDSYTNAVTLGLNSTPTFILNGEKLSLPASVDAFSQVIDAALESLPQDEASESAEMTL